MAANERKEMERIKRDIVIGFGNADAVATRVAYFFSDPKTRKESDIVQPWERFPTLFVDQKEKAQKRKRDDELQKYKASMMAFADRWNRRNKNVTERNL